jgi:hypothetical protein
MRDPLDGATNLSMKPVLRTTDRSLVESLRLALDAAGIVPVLSNDSGSVLPFIPVTIAVEDDDYERALALVHDLEPSSSRPDTGPVGLTRTPRTILWALLALGILFFCGL